MYRDTPATHYLEVFKGSEWVRCHPKNLIAGDIVRILTVKGEVVKQNNSDHGLMEVTAAPTVEDGVMQLSLEEIKYNS